MENSNIKTGDIFFYRGKSFISKSIEFFMSLLGKELQKPEQWIPSHCGTFILLGGELFIGESVENGFKIRKFNEFYDLSKDDCKISTLIIPYTEEEVQKVKDKIFDLSNKSWGYGYQTLGSWVVKILSLCKIDFFTQIQGLLVCYQSTCIIGKYSKESNWKTIDNPYKVNIYDILNNKNYKIII